MKGRRPPRTSGGPRFDLNLPVDTHSELQVQKKKTNELTTFFIDGNDALESPMITTKREANDRLVGSFSPTAPPLLAAREAVTAPSLLPAAPLPCPPPLVPVKKVAPAAPSPAVGGVNPTPQFFHVDNTNLFILIDGISMFYEGKSTYTGSIDPSLLKKMGQKELLRKKGLHDSLEPIDTVEMAIRDIESAVSPVGKMDSGMTATEGTRENSGKSDVGSRAEGASPEPAAVPSSSSCSQYYPDEYLELFKKAKKFSRPPLFRRGVAKMPPPRPPPSPEPFAPPVGSPASTLSTTSPAQSSPVTRHKHQPRITSSGSFSRKKSSKHDIALDSIGFKNDSVVLDDVIFCRVIGSGSQGTVSMVELNKKFYAMKRINVQEVTETANAMERHVRKRGLIRELEMIREQNGNESPKNLLRMFNAVVKKSDEREDLYLLMELMWRDVAHVGMMMARLSFQETFKITQMTFKEYVSGDTRHSEELERLQTDLRGTSKHVCGRMKFSEAEPWEGKVEDSRRTPFPEIILSLLAADVLMGLKELHDDYHLVHCDLKPGNILLSYDKEHFKIADFGCSRPLDPLTKRVCGSGMDVGTKLYKSPERFLCGEGEEQANFSGKADVWSLGVILLELSAGIHPCHPFKTDYWNYGSNLRLSKMLKPLRWSSGLFDFILRCTFVSEEERWSVHQLMRHPFISRYRNVPRRRLANFMVRLESDSDTIHKRQQCAWLEEQIRLSCLASKVNYKRQSYTLWREFTSFLPREAPPLNDRTVYPELQK